MPWSIYCRQLLNAFVNAVPYLRDNAYFTTVATDRDPDTLAADHALHPTKIGEATAAQIDLLKLTHWTDVETTYYIPKFDTGDSTTYKDALDTEKATFAPSFAS
jgi:hypothetical protein